MLARLRRAVALALPLVGLGWSPAAAVEYRLLIASFHEPVFLAYLVKPDELADGATGPGLDRLEAGLDAGEVGKGGLAFDRHVAAPGPVTVRAIGAATVSADVRKGGEGKVLWDEVRWEGRPGQISVWVVRATEQRPQELAHVALRGLGPLRHFEPAGWTGGARRPVLRLPLGTLRDEEERGTLGQRQVRPAIDLSHGVAVLVGSNENRNHADLVYLLVGHEALPTTYRVVLAWRPAPGRDVLDAPVRGRRPRR